MSEDFNSQERKLIWLIIAGVFISGWLSSAVAGPVEARNHGGRAERRKRSSCWAESKKRRGREEDAGNKTYFL